MLRALTYVTGINPCYDECRSA